MDKIIQKNLQHIRKNLKKNLKKSRFEHTLGVEFISAALAMKYSADIYKAQLSGLLHDCTKNLTDAEQLSYCKSNNIEITKVEERYPYLVHGKTGAHYAKETYDINDLEVLDAIKHHTTGKINMTLLEKIVFTADYIEPSRNKAPNLNKIRKIAFENIDEAIILIFEDTLNYLKTNNQEIDSTTLNAYQYLIKNRKDTNK